MAVSVYRVKGDLLGLRRCDCAIPCPDREHRVGIDSADVLTGACSGEAALVTVALAWTTTKPGWKWARWMYGVSVRQMCGDAPGDLDRRVVCLAR